MATFLLTPHSLPILIWVRTDRRTKLLTVGTTSMWDLISILASIAFFAIAIEYVRGCENL
jgi:hypothetical protein